MLPWHRRAPRTGRSGALKGRRTARAGEASATIGRARAARCPTAAVLDDVVRRIVAVAQPERIILFGSAARGGMGPHSDFDLLIVKEGAHRRNLAGRIYENLHGCRRGRGHSRGRRALPGQPCARDQAGARRREGRV